MGNVYAELKNFSKSLYYYNRALDLKSPVKDIYNAIARLFYDFENYFEAEIYYKMTLSLDKDNVPANAGIGSLLYEDSRLGERSYLL